MPSTRMFLEKLRGAAPILYDSTTAHLFHEQHQQHVMMEEVQHQAAAAAADQLAQFPCE